MSRETDRIRISAVSYFNSQPFIYGLKNSPISGQINLSLDIPSECARKLLDGEADIGLVPVAILPLLKKYSIISDFCIGANGAVKSVYLFSNTPLSELNTIFLDHHSKTSNNLARVLARYHWTITPRFVYPQEEMGPLNHGEAFIQIGDRTFGKAKDYALAYDLSEEWFSFTGLPFVFAVWVSTEELPVFFRDTFNQALQQGLNDRNRVIRDFQVHVDKGFDAEDYLQNRISYQLDEKKTQGLRLFLHYLKGLEEGEADHSEERV